MAKGALSNLLRYVEFLNLPNVSDVSGIVPSCWPLPCLLWHVSTFHCAPQCLQATHFSQTNPCFFHLTTQVRTAAGAQDTGSRTPGRSAAQMPPTSAPAGASPRSGARKYQALSKLESPKHNGTIRTDLRRQTSGQLSDTPASTTVNLFEQAYAPPGAKAKRNSPQAPRRTSLGSDRSHTLLTRYLPKVNLI